MTFVRDNAKLLAAYRCGERESLAQIYDHYAPELASLIRRGFSTGSQMATRVPGVLDPQRQCDLLQETFLRAFSEKARQGYRAGSPFRTYLFTIAKNLMVDNLRRFESRHVDVCAAGDIDVILERNAPFEPEEPLHSLLWRRQHEVANYCSCKCGRITRSHGV